MAGLSRAIIHHTAGSGDYSSNLENSKAVMRNVQNYHMSLSGWCDIAYHFLTDAAGNLFEGRSGAMTGLPRGTHDGCNANSFGFTALGYYHPPYNQAFTSASRNALEAVIAWRMPSDWSSYGSGTYCSASVGFLDGHYRVKSTACPGDIIIPQIPGMRDGVNTRKNPPPPPPALVASSAPRMKGDFNGDGREDVAIAYDYGAGRTALFAGLSSGSSFTTFKWWESTSGWEASRIQWVAGDFNGDGKTDVGALYNYGGSASTLWIFLSTGSSFNNATIWWSAASGWEAGRSKMVAGDFNADGRHDIVIAYDYGNTSTALFTFLSTGTAFSGAEWWRAASGWEAPRSKWVSGDFNGDGRCDVAALYNYGNSDTAMFMFSSSGSSFAGVQWWRSGAGNFDWNRAKAFGGNFNGDTRSDICVAYDYGSMSTGLLTYLSTGSSFTGGIWWQALSGWEPARSQWVSGDFDADGKTDVTAMYNYGNSDSALFMFRSTGTSFPGGTQWWRSGIGNWDWTRSTAF